MMKKLTILSFGLFLAFSAVSTASAAYCVSGNTGYMYGYFGNGCVTTQPVQQSYYYTQGCYTYYYDAYTLSSRVISYNCQSYAYTSPVTYTYYTSPYYTYRYNNGSWYPQYGNSYYYGGTPVYYYTNDNLVPTPNVNCYYQNGYQLCQ